MTIALNKVLSTELILEGLARELVNKVQFMRKESNLDIVDRIRIGYEITDENRKNELAEAIRIHKAYIMQETLAKHLTPLDSSATNVAEWNINGIKMRMTVAKEEHS